MYPLDFEEFAIANGLCSDTIVYLKKCYENIVPVTESVHQSMLKLFRYYIIVGGMPAAVEKFVETQSIAEVLNVQNNLISLYRQDIIKYSSSGQKKIKTIFDMIARRTAAVFYPAYEYEAVKVLTRCRDEMFKTTGRNVTREGWKAVYAGTEKEEESGAKRKKAEEPEEKPLPPLKEGDEYSLQSTAIKKETTKPPAPHTDASLLYAMENAGRDLDDEALREQMKGSGLGTPATRAAMIERLIKVGYAQRRGKAIQPTEKGIQLIELVPQELSSPEMTGKWELALHEIAENRRECAPFMDSIRRYSVFLVEFARDRAPEKQIAEEKKNAGKKRAASGGPIADVACPLCGKAHDGAAGKMPSADGYTASGRSPAEYKTSNGSNLSGRTGKSVKARR